MQGGLGVELLDPYEVGEGWFEIEWPSLQMRTTDRVPEAMRARAAFTLKRLGLRDGETALRYRRQWIERYEQGLPLHVLDEIFPLLAQAIQRSQAEPLVNPPG